LLPTITQNNKVQNERIIYGPDKHDTVMCDIVGLSICVYIFHLQILIRLEAARRQKKLPAKRTKTIYNVIHVAINFASALDKSFSKAYNQQMDRINEEWKRERQLSIMNEVSRSKK
jgi:hypothetical protein